MGMMDGICCAQQPAEEQYNEATREELEKFFALYDMKDGKSNGPGSQVSTATTTTTSNSSLQWAASKYTAGLQEEAR